MTQLIHPSEGYQIHQIVLDRGGGQTRVRSPVGEIIDMCPACLTAAEHGAGHGTYEVVEDFCE